MTKMLTFLAVLAAVAGLAQEENTRQIWNRPPAKTETKKASKPPAVTYKPLGPPKAAPNGAPGNETKVGVTLWRIRPAKAADPKGARLLVLVRPGAKATEEVPERVDPKSELSDGDQFRLSVEVPSSGYLYVIDREKFKDGAMGAPYLIYPNWQTPTGDNVVAPGRVLEIPGRRDEVNVFTLQPKANQVSEVLSLLVSPEPIAGLKIGHDPLELSAAVYAGWEKKWAVEAQQFELVGDQSPVMTDKENQAGAGSGPALTQDDPLPQTLYKLNVKPGTGVLVEVPLKIKQ